MQARDDELTLAGGQAGDSVCVSGRGAQMWAWTVVATVVSDDSARVSEDGVECRASAVAAKDEARQHVMPVARCRG